jgi:RNA polymerase sigma-70 factor (ECF subfamily)
MCSTSEKEGSEKVIPKGPAQEPDIALVESAIRGDPDSFTELCRRHYPAMVAIAHSVLGDRHLAEDAAQQTFAKAAVKLPQLKKKSRFAGWLAAICRNFARDMAQSTKLLQSDDITTKTTAAELHNDNEVEVVKEALGKLSASAREVIFLRYYDGMSYEQISAVLGISEQAINGRLRRAKRKLAHYLRRCGLDRCNYE